MTDLSSNPNFAAFPLYDLARVKVPFQASVSLFWEMVITVVIVQIKLEFNLEALGNSTGTTHAQ